MFVIDDGNLKPPSIATHTRYPDSFVSHSFILPSVTSFAWISEVVFNSVPFVRLLGGGALRTSRC